MQIINEDVIHAIAAASDLPPRAIIASFRESTAEEMDAIRRATVAGANDVLAQHAHRVCGAGEMVGATALAQASRALHAAASHGARADIAVALAALEEAVRALDRHLEERDGT